MAKGGWRAREGPEVVEEVQEGDTVVVDEQMQNPAEGLEVLHQLSRLCSDLLDANRREGSHRQRPSQRPTNLCSLAATSTPA